MKPRQVVLFDWMPAKQEKNFADVARELCSAGGAFPDRKNMERLMPHDGPVRRFKITIEEIDENGVTVFDAEAGDL